MRHRPTLALLAFCAAVGAILPPAVAEGVSPYAGQQNRAIKSLSDDDLAELQRGGGWGLAKAAELNGMPGPAHLLELKDAIGLGAEQVAAIEALFAEMQTAAIETGARLIELETELEAGFRDRTISEDALRELLDRIAATRSELRFIHLGTHLKTVPLLTPHQIVTYNRLRGYESGGGHGGHAMQHGHQ